MLALLGSGPKGLSDSQAEARRGPRGDCHPVLHTLLALLRRLGTALSSPLLLILVFGASVALLAREWLNATIVLGIIVVTSLLGAWHEHRASTAVAALRQRIALRAQVRRSGRVCDIAADAVVPGDVVLLSAGSLIPADGVLLDAKDCYVSQALLTGETFPVERQPGISAATASLPERGNCLFAGTSLRSGTATLLAIGTGDDSEFGRIAHSLARQPPETEFEHGLRHFGQMLLQVMLVMVMVVLTVNILIGRPPLDTLLFSVALAVGMSPELLPAILSITLSRGAQRMAHRGVIVRRLNAIENLGSMDVLCTDKTGTLTRGVVQLDAARDAQGQDSAAVLERAFINASLQAGLANTLDEAVVAAGAAQQMQLGGRRKLDEVPYDFVRKRLSVAVGVAGAAPQLICKGALEAVLAICDRVEQAGIAVPLDAVALQGIQQRYADWSAQGYRVLGVAYKPLAVQAGYGRDDECQLIFSGFLLFLDPPEAGVSTTLAALAHLGVAVKIVTGDNRLVARHVAEAVGLPPGELITGGDLASMKDEALWHLAPRTAVFAEVDPNQKERIIQALRRTGHVVGYIGDGINDAPALHAADVGISVDSAVDVAKDAADIVLLKHDLRVLRQGIDEGRRTFANTLKYIFITTSANFGNMISMALATLFLPFLPLLASQVLLNNFLSDVPAMALAGDNVDPEWEHTPHRWDVGMVRRFMLTFGLISALFDLLSFATLVALAGEVAERFRTGWFVESVLTELLIIFVVRSYRPIQHSRPHPRLLAAAIAVGLLTLLLPYLPGISSAFGLVPLPLPLLAAMLAISLLYAAASEAAKRRFYRRLSSELPGPDPGRRHRRKLDPHQHRGAGKA